MPAKVPQANESPGNRRRTVGDHRQMPYKQKKRTTFVILSLCRHLPIFPVRRQTSIFGACELNYCVRNGNRWTLAAINTYYLIGDRHIEN